MPKYQQIYQTIDSLKQWLINNKPDADLITVEKFIGLIKTNYYFKFWKENEFDLYMLQIFTEIYDKIDPLKNNWPRLKEKYEDLTENIAQQVNTAGQQEECDPATMPVDEVAVKKYIVDILTQTSNYNVNSSKVSAMNRNLIADFEKILAQPTEFNILKTAVLSLQPYVYDEQKSCNDCGRCSKCIAQKFDTNEAYYIDLKKQLNELCERMGYYEWKKIGPKGDRGLQGEQGMPGEKGQQGEQGIQGEKGDKGEQGIQGGKGDKGDTGDTGPAGPQGEQGPQGEKGDKGDKGDTGDTGPAGPQGEQGPQGEKGDKGDKGEKGDPGSDVAWDDLKTPITIKADTDGHTVAHFDNETVQLYNKEGKSVLFIRDDIRFTRKTDNAVTLIYDPADGTLKYGTQAAPVEVAVKDEILFKYETDEKINITPKEISNEGIGLLINHVELQEPVPLGDNYAASKAYVDSKLTKIVRYNEIADAITSKLLSRLPSNLKGLTWNYYFDEIRTDGFLHPPTPDFKKDYLNPAKFHHHNASSDNDIYAHLVHGNPATKFAVVANLDTVIPDEFNVIQTFSFSYGDDEYKVTRIVIQSQQTNAMDTFDLTDKEIII